MQLLSAYFLVMLVIQFFHSIEELTNKFHERFPLFKMTFRFFLTFEVAFFLLWLIVFTVHSFPARSSLMAFFILLMFANGLWHVVWAGIEKRYVPGLATAPFFVIAFIIFYFQII